MREAIILAAGFGMRLRPITDVIPKAVFPVLERPLVVWQIERLKERGFKRFYINTHYLAEKVVKAVKDYGEEDNVIFQQENPILLTGGGLKGLLEKVKNGHVLVHNVDIIEDFNLEELFRVHELEDNDITWELAEDKGTVKVNKNRVVDIGDDGVAFTGVGVYKKEIISLMPARRFHLIPWIKEHIGRLKVGYVLTDKFWVDMGTPSGVFLAYKHLLKNKSLILGNVTGKVRFRGFVYIGKNVKIYGTGVIEDTIVLGRAVINGTFNIRRSIIYEDRRVAF